MTAGAALRLLQQRGSQHSYMRLLLQQQARALTQCRTRKTFIMLFQFSQ
jgi:hypothetical protein